MEHPISGRRNTDSGPRASVRDSIFEKPRAKATSSKIPSSKLQRSTKLQAQKSVCARAALASVFGVWCLGFGISLELGVWCWVFRSAGASRAEMCPDRVRAGASSGNGAANLSGFARGLEDESPKAFSDGCVGFVVVAVHPCRGRGLAAVARAESRWRVA